MSHFHHASDRAPETRGSIIHWADRYDTVVRILTLGRERSLREMTTDLAGIRPGDRVLEVGCGTGALTRVAKRRAGPAGQVFGIDPSPEMIDVARRKAARANSDIDFRLGVIEALPFPDDSFDVVLSSLMAHHLPDDLKPRAFGEVRRVLKPGGRLLVVDVKHPTNWTGRLAMTLMMHGRLTSGVQDLVGLLQSAGFTQTETGDTRFGMLGYTRACRP